MHHGIQAPSLEPTEIAEALSIRADAQRRVEQLRHRIASNARFQEGEEPAVASTELLAEAEQVLTELESWIRRIHRTNAAIDLGSDSTMKVTGNLGVRFSRAPRSPAPRTGDGAQRRNHHRVGPSGEGGSGASRAGPSTQHAQVRGVSGSG